jgi:predicted outer membrane repeat protein
MNKTLKAGNKKIKPTKERKKDSGLTRRLSLGFLSTSLVLAGLFFTYSLIINDQDLAQAGSLTNCSEAGLVSEIGATPEGGTVDFNCPDNTTITLNSTINPGKDITLDGTNSNNLTISGGNSVRHFETTNNNLTLKNLKISNGFALGPQSGRSCDGGAVRITFGILTLDGVTFENNFATRGGAVCGNFESKVFIIDSTFRNNSGNVGGAIVTNTSTLDISGSLFESNSTTPIDGQNGIGGAIRTFGFFETKEINIDSSRFVNNIGYHEGGAMFLSLGNGIDLNLTNSTFVGNEAILNSDTGIGSGGAVKLAHNSSKSTANITNIAFYNNVADQEGGAIWSGGGSANLDMNLTEVTFYGNEAGRVSDDPNPVPNETAGGAALFNHGDNGIINLDRVTIAENLASNETSGGFAVAMPLGNIYLKDTIFHNNCSTGDFADGTINDCDHYVHARTATEQFSETNSNNYEFPANKHLNVGLRPLSQNINVLDVNLQAFADNGLASPDHPCSDVNSGSGGECSNQNPVVSITSPSSDQSILNTETLEVIADASDIDGTITQVVLTIDSVNYPMTLASGDSTNGSYTYTIDPNTLGLSAGNYTVSVTASDNDLATGVDSFNLDISDSDPAITSGDILITEINWIGSSASSNDEWIELYNNTDSELDLTGLVVTNLGTSGSPDIVLNNSDCSNLSIAANSYFVISKRGLNSDQSILNVTPDCVISGISVLNAGEDLSLEYSSTVIDSVSF